MSYFTLALIIFLFLLALGLSVILLCMFLDNSKAKKIPYPPRNLNNKLNK